MKQHILVLLIASLLAISSLGIGLSVIDGAPQRGGDRDLTLEGDGEQTTADDSETEVVEDEGPCYGNITLFKYYDVDGNGEYDGDDYPIGKWYFEVYRKVENPPELHGLNIETETDVSPVWDLYDSGYTAGDGYLTIEIECNRHYKVVEYLDQFEEEWYFTGGKVVGGSADDDDFEDKDGQVEITFWDRCEDVEIWFGNAQEEIYGDITVSKFHDENHDGEWNSDEELIDGFYFQLWYADEDGTPIAPIGDPMETSDGIYTFEDLELGNYVVQEIMPEVGEEECCWASTTGLLQHVEVYDDEMYNLYFGNVRGGSIEGMKFLDIEADGNFDVGMDKPLMDWQIYLWTNVDGGPGEVVDTTYTDRMGDFYFDCVAPGEYFVQEEMYEGWYNVKPDVVPVYVESCETSEKIEFANCMFKDIYGIKYFDYNQTGSFDQEVDWVLGGWPIQLLNEDEEVIQTTETQPNGYYFFEGLKVGTYYVEELIPEDEDPEAWVNTTESKVEVVMTCCNSCTLVNFGNYQYPEVTIVKYHDTNMNGIYDIDEELVIESVWFDVEGYNDIGPFLPYELEVFGEWSFYTDEGHYTITERLPEGWHNTTPLMQSFTLGPADEVTVEFGNVKYGHIEVYKFYDEDMNSEWDDGEEMLSGWEFNLWTTDEDGLPDETIHTNETGECGCYVFEDLLPGLYAVQEIEQCCWFPTTDVIQYVEVVAGETAEAWFGNVEGGWIWGYKYCDVNMNQEFDEDECGTEDVTINLWSVNETTGEPEVILETTTTDETGYYEFMCLEPGEYYVQEDVPEGWYNSTPALVMLDIAPATGYHVDFGNYRYGDIYGLKYCDFNMNGEFDECLDWPLYGWEIQLWEADERGNPTVHIDTAYTDEWGMYRFEELGPGDYVVKEVLEPCGWTNTTDMEVHVRLGCVEEVEVNFGNYRQSDISVKAYDYEMMEPVAGLVLYLWEADEYGEPIGEGPIAEGVTGPHGYYVFANYDPGYYVIQTEDEQFEFVILRCCTAYVVLEYYDYTPPEDHEVGVAEHVKFE